MQGVRVTDGYPMGSWIGPIKEVVKTIIPPCDVQRKEGLNDWTMGIEVLVPRRDGTDRNVWIKISCESIKSLFDQVRPFTCRPGSVLEFEMPYDTFKDCLTKTSSCDPRYMDMELLMNTLYPEQKVLQIWTMLTRELTRSSNTNFVEAYPVETGDGDP